MKIEVIDWSTLIRYINKNSDLTIEDIGYKCGISGSALLQLYKPEGFSEARYGEGEELIRLFYQCDGEELPIKKRSHDVVCSSCQRLRKRSELMRVKESMYRCVDCLNKAKKRKGLY